MSYHPIDQRRSIRRFQDRPVPQEALQEMIRAASLAPSGKNRQPWKYIVFANQEKERLLERMEAGIQQREQGAGAMPRATPNLASARRTLRVMRQAPVVIVILNTGAHSPFLPTETAEERFIELFDSLSIGASVENMLLKAVDLGLGTLWVGNTCYAYHELTEFLEVDCQLVGAVAVGYPDQTPLPRPRKAMEEIVEFRL